MIYTRNIHKPPQGRRLRPDNHWSKDGLVGCWVMNEGAGNKIYDLSGNDNYGTFSADTLWQDGGVFCPVTGAGKVTTGLRTDQITQKNTIVLGYKAVNSTAYQHLWGTETSGTAFWLRRSSSSTTSVDLAAAGGSTSHTIGVNLFDGSYRNVAIVCDIVTGGAGDKQYFHVDGSLVLESATNYNWDTNNYRLIVGGREADAYEADGIFSYFYVYNRILVPSEIAQLHREPYAMFEYPQWIYHVAAAGGLSIGVNGVAAASIASVCGVAAASIAKINGATA